MVRPEIQATVEAIAKVLDEIAREMPTHIAVGVDTPPPASRTRARSALDALSARILQVRPIVYRQGEFRRDRKFRSLHRFAGDLTGYIERLLDEPPQPPAAAPANNAAPQSTEVRIPQSSAIP